MLISTTSVLFYISNLLYEIFIKKDIYFFCRFVEWKERMKNQNIIKIFILWE